MGEIKFRAWIKSLDVMADVLSIDFEDKTVLLKGYKRNTLASFDQIVLLGYTGLEDSNGAEIYEADIVKRSVYLPGDFAVQNIGVIKYFNPDARFVFRYEGLNLEANNRHKQEVIGNIYENPELLEVTAKVGPDEYQKHYLGLSDNVTYTVEQLGTSNVSEYNYEMIFKPKSIMPIKIEYKNGEEVINTFEEESE